MKAKCKCPNCGEEVIEECEACIQDGTLLHTCKKGDEPKTFEVDWEIIEN